MRALKSIARWVKRTAGLQRAMIPWPRSVGTGLAALLLVLAGVLARSDVSAEVTLLYFRAAAQPDGSILLEWETETERDTTAFRLYRAAGEDGVEQYLEGSQQAAQGDTLSGYPYAYSDHAVTPGVTYYYTLAEIANGVVVKLVKLPDRAVATALVPATPTPTSSPTPTPSRTASPARTATRRAVSLYEPTDTATDRPTATRRFTVTPLPADTARPSATRPPAQLAPIQPAVPTPGQGQVATPTGQAATPLSAATATLVLLPTVSPTPPPAGPTEASTAELIASLAPSPTKPPSPTSTSMKTARLILDTPEAQPTPTPALAPPEERGDRVRWLLPLGGGVLGLAVLAGLAGVLIWYLRNR